MHFEGFFYRTAPHFEENFDLFFFFPWYFLEMVIHIASVSKHVHGVLVFSGGNAILFGCISNGRFCYKSSIKPEVMPNYILRRQSLCEHWRFGMLSKMSI